MWTSPVAPVEQLSLLNSSCPAAPCSHKDRKGKREAEEWEDEQEKQGVVIFRQPRIAASGQRGLDEGYFGVFRRASDKLVLQYWCQCSRLTEDCKSQVTVIYGFANTCYLCFHIIAAYYLCEPAKLRKLVQTCFEVNPEEPTASESSLHICVLVRLGTATVVVWDS